jgi:hypothetical protein
VFEKVRLARAAAHFARERLPHYGPLLTEDLHRFRDEIVKATVGAAISATAALLFCCFVSLAVILSAAEGTHRSLTAWVVCACWGILALLGVWIARRAVAAPPPFGLVAHAFSRDYAMLMEELEPLTDPDHPHT